MNLLLLGFGYSAQALVRLAGDRFDRIDGTTRSGTERQEGAVRIHVFDGAEPSPGLLAAVAAADVVVVSAAPDKHGDPFLPALAAALGASPRLRLVQYLSTIGVYGDHGGAWIDEDAPCEPKNARSRWRVEAETAWQAFGRQYGKSIQIHRLAGIYGPGRNALVDLARGSARRIDKPGQVFNRIHVADIAAALLAGMPYGDGIFNICDDEPAPASDVVTYAAGLLGVPPPPLISIEQAGLSEMGLSFYSTNKRCRNGRAKAALDFALAYPTYRDGLRALLATGEGNRTV